MRRGASAAKPWPPAATRALACEAPGLLPEIELVVPYQVGSLLRLGADVASEVGAAQAQRAPAERRDALLELRRLDRCLNGLVQGVDDLGRRAGRHEDTEPVSG